MAVSWRLRRRLGTRTRRLPAPSLDDALLATTRKTNWAYPKHGSQRQTAVRRCRPRREPAYPVWHVLDSRRMRHGQLSGQHVGPSDMPSSQAKTIAGPRRVQSAALRHIRSHSNRVSTPFHVKRGDRLAGNASAAVVVAGSVSINACRDHVPQALSQRSASCGS